MTVAFSDECFEPETAAFHGGVCVVDLTSIHEGFRQAARLGAALTLPTIYKAPRADVFAQFVTVDVLTGPTGGVRIQITVDAS